MKKDLNIKTSLQLLICNILIFALFASGILFLYLARQDRRTETEKQEEYQQSVMNTKTFKNATDIVNQLITEYGDYATKHISKIECVKFENAVYLKVELSGINTLYYFKNNGLHYTPTSKENYDTLVTGLSQQYKATKYTYAEEALEIVIEEATKK